MLTDGPIELLLQIDEGTDPIQGRLTLAGETTRAFRGWLGLAAAIEELTRVAPARQTPTAPTEED
ncbi:MAG TPA: hypothetical protein VN238_21100 [Solirubrobacteraceae bacterium]|nr:hypothetical protein [Solirubrobacteraceae bacterium]